MAELNGRLASAGSPLRVGAARFRPNLVVSGCAPHAEDAWGELELRARAPGGGEGAALRLETRGLCGRCDLVNVGAAGETALLPAADAEAPPAMPPCADRSCCGVGPRPGEDAPGTTAGLAWSSLPSSGAGAGGHSCREPLLTLAGYRRQGGRVRFGVYAAPAEAAAPVSPGSDPPFSAKESAGVAPAARAAGASLLGWAGAGFEVIVRSSTTDSSC